MRGGAPPRRGNRLKDDWKRMQESEIETAIESTNAEGSSPDDLQASKHGQARGSNAWYVVFVLMICYTLSFIDRQILSLLVGPIKSDLGVSEKQLGLLGGLAFGIFYTLLGLPMGRIVDRSSRRNLVAIGVFFWSLMTALCAVAKGY